MACVLALAKTGCADESPVEVASREGILIMGNTGEPKGLDPHIVSGVLESNVIRSLFEGLVEAHPSKDGVLGHGKPGVVLGDFREEGQGGVQLDL